MLKLLVLLDRGFQSIFTSPYLMGMVFAYTIVHLVWTPSWFYLVGMLVWGYLFGMALHNHITNRRVNTFLRHHGQKIEGTLKERQELRGMIERGDVDFEHES